MRPRIPLTCLWPGLPRLWSRGEPAGLLQAVAFAAGLNLLLLASFAWVQLLPAWILVVLWLAVGGWWIGALWSSFPRFSRTQDAVATPDANEGLFRRAQAEYLHGHWFEAQSLTEELLHDNPWDVEAGLMLAALFRHTRRIDAARRQLDGLQQQPRAETWRLEIQHERQLLARLENDGNLPEAEAPESSSEELNTSQAA